MSEAIAGGPVETLERRPMSWEEYLALPEHPRTEFVDGVVVVAPDPTFQHQRVARKLANLFDELDGVFGSTSGNVRLPGNRVRIPDAFATTAPGHLFQERPLLVAEVLSPSTRSEDLLRKGPEYAGAGIEQFWVADPDARTLEVHELVDGAWELVVRFDENQPAGAVAVGDHGTVPIDLLDLLDG